MKKENLKDGMIVDVVWYDGEVERYLMIGGRMVNEQCWFDIKTMHDNLMDEAYEIERVYKSKNLCMLEEIFDEDKLEMIWSRRWS